jgi:NitT/TauT family transport system substrate-binding protein
MKRTAFLGATFSTAAALALDARAAEAVAVDAPATFDIAYQPGLAYAPLVVMKTRGTLERRFPQTQFGWRSLSGGSSVRDAMVAGQIQLGIAGTAPFLIGWEHEPDLKMLCGLSVFDIWLVAKDPALKTLRDLKPGMKIGTPDLGGSNVLILQMACQRAFGNPHALDAAIVTMPHPLAVQALETGQIAAHFSTPPFQFEEVARGAHVVLRSADVIGPSTFTAGLAMQSFYEKYPQFMRALYGAIDQAAAFVADTPAVAAGMLVAEMGTAGVTATTMQGWLSHPGMGFDVVPHGVMRYAHFMSAIGVLANPPASVHDVLLPPAGKRGD